MLVVSVASICKTRTEQRGAGVRPGLGLSVGGFGHAPRKLTLNMQGSSQGCTKGRRGML